MDHGTLRWAKWSQDLIDITLRRMDHDRDGRISFSDFATTVQVQNPGYFHLLGRNLTLYQRKDKYFLSFHSVMILLINDNLQDIGVKPVSMCWQKSHAWLLLFFFAWIHVAMDIQTEMSTTPFSTFWNLGLCALHSVQLICNWEFKVCSVCLIGCLFYRRRGAKVIFSWLGSILFAGSVLAHCYNNHI